MLQVSAAAVLNVVTTTQYWNRRLQLPCEYTRWQTVFLFSNWEREREEDERDEGGDNKNASVAQPSTNELTTSVQS